MDDPRLTEVSPPAGADNAIVFIKGMWTKKEGPKATGKWLGAIRSAGWAGSVHHLWWDASTWKAAPTHVNFWNTSRRRAKRVGELWLAGLLDELGSRPITLLGHSLGARVIHAGLLAGAAQGRVENVVLLGGAVRRKRRKWDQVGAVVEGKVINVFNRKDRKLGLVRKLTPHKTNFCGRNAIEANASPQILNFNATQLIGSTSHSSSRYLKVLPTVVAKLGW